MSHIVLNTIIAFLEKDQVLSLTKEDITIIKNCLNPRFVADAKSFQLVTLPNGDRFISVVSVHCNQVIVNLTNNLLTSN